MSKDQIKTLLILGYGLLAYPFVVSMLTPKPIVEGKCVVWAPNDRGITLCHERRVQQ